MVISKRLSPRPIFALYDMHEMSKPQLMKALMNVMTSQYMKALTKEFINITPITTTNGIPADSVVLVYSSGFAKTFINNGKFSDYNGSVYHIGQTTYIIGLSLNYIRCLLIQSPRGDQEDTVIKGYYLCAFNIYKAWRFAKGDFDTDHHYGFYYTLINEPEEWDAAKQYIEQNSHRIFGISFDIETAGFPKFISAFGFTLMMGSIEKPEFKSYCISMGVHSYPWHIRAMQYLCYHPAPKIAHNGAYDCTVLLRYRIPVWNMLYDTMLMAHSLMCDAPKRLSDCASYYLPDYVYWKSEITGRENGISNEESNNDSEDKHGVPATQEGRLVYYKYCAKDTYYTACICLEMLALFQQKPWAVKNYCMVHFLQYRVGIFMGLAGMPIDKAKFDVFVKEVCATRDELLSDLRTYAKDELFNPASPKEVQQYLYGTLGLKLPRGIRLKKPKAQRPSSKPASRPKAISLLDLDDLDLFNSSDIGPAQKPEQDFSLYPTDKVALRFLIDQNPEYETQIQKLLDYRWYAKVISNYLMSNTLLVDSTTDKNVKVLLYNPSIAKTVTCRYGGGESNLGVGAYHLNLPPGLWKCIKVPEGHVRYSIDYSHSDDYFVAFYSGVPTMIENVVRTDLDLHMKHASLIFQRPYDYLMEHKKDKDSEAPLLRKLTKSIGHGCKYLMGGYTMYTNMGDPNICAAIDALHADVDKHSLDQKIQFASYLQSLFYKQYDGLTQWHKDVFTKLMANPDRLITVGNWTRQLLAPASWFSVHSGSVAQYGQAGTSSNSNAFLRKFFRKPLDSSSYIFAQVHDAMDGFARNEDEVKAIAKIMEEPITVTDIYGTTRTFSVATETEEFWPDSTKENNT